VRVPPCNQYQITEKVASAINDQDLRKSIRVMNDIHEVHEPMHDLPRLHLEALRDAPLEMSQDRTGPRGELKAAWYKYATTALLDDACRRERGDVLGFCKDYSKRVVSGLT
jgi:hypothetical protein